jgi:TATA-box binding protein (TBP) (component of TFIID and TFIIIB)
VKNINSIIPSIRHFCILLKLDFNCIDIKTIAIDNITASGTFNTEVDLIDLKSALQNSPNQIKVVYNQNKFPGLHVKLKTPAKSNPALIAFTTGKYTIVGAKCQSDIAAIHALIKPFVMAVKDLKCA